MVDVGRNGLPPDRRKNMCKGQGKRVSMLSSWDFEGDRNIQQGLQRSSETEMHTGSEYGDLLIQMLSLPAV